MSWVEDPGVESVGDYPPFEELNVDQAFLNVTSTAIKKLFLYHLPSSCIECPYQLLSNVSSTGEVLKVSTTYPTKFRFRTDDSNFTVPHDEHDNYLYCETENLHLGQFGIYELEATQKSPSGFCYELNEIHPPVNIYYAFLIAVFVYLVLGVCVYLFNYFMKSRLTPAEPAPISITTLNGVQAKVADAAKPPQRQRLRSLDTFRGICIVVMIFVNDGGAHYYFLEHAAWNGLYVADLVFPWFLWIMGVCIPMSIKSSRKRNTPAIEIITRIFIRSLKLIAIGLVLGSLGGVDIRDMRIPGVLQRFGVCYFVCSILVLFFLDVNSTIAETKNKILAIFLDIKVIWIGWLAALLLLAAHTIITFYLEVPGCPTGYLGPGGLHNNEAVASHCVGGAAGYIDRQLFTEKHIYNWPTSNAIYVPDGDGTPYDPEGLLGTLTSIFQVWCGVQTGVTMLIYPDALSRIKRWLAWGVVFGAVGGLLCKAQTDGGWIPVNKNLWSISFVLVTNAFALFLLSFMYFLIDMKKWWSGSPFYEPGMNSILLYVGHSVGNSCLPWHWAYGRMETHGIKLFESLWGTSLWVVIAVYLNAKKIYWIL